MVPRGSQTPARHRAAAPHRRALPAGWEQAFERELASDNSLYVAALRRSIATFGGPEFKTAHAVHTAHAVRAAHAVHTPVKTITLGEMLTDAQLEHCRKLYPAPRIVNGVRLARSLEECDWSGEVVNGVFRGGAYYPLGCAEDMGEGAYQAMCDELDYEEVRSPKSLNEPVGRWRTRDGRVLAIEQMETSHLKNAIALFEKSGWGDHFKIWELREELERRT